MLTSSALIFVDRSPSLQELERFRLILSTYQDGSGMLRVSTGHDATLPGWRDFERTVAAAFAGQGGEDKYFVDVVFPLTQSPWTFYGVDRKMRAMLSMVDTRQRIYVEVTNAAKFLWAALGAKGITEANIHTRAQLAGETLITSLEEDKKYGAEQYPYGPINTTKSSYLVLLYNSAGSYQLFQLPLALPQPEDLVWKVFYGKGKDGRITSRLVGTQAGSVLYEWYGQSGGQFKYYPHISAALWESPRFTLEPLNTNVTQSLLVKARSYFPDLWAQI